MSPVESVVVVPDSLPKYEELLDIDELAEKLKALVLRKNIHIYIYPCIG